MNDIEIKFLKETKTCNPGDVVFTSKKSAEECVKEGLAEYVNPTIKKQKKRYKTKPINQKELQIIIKPSQLKELREKYTGVDLGKILNHYLDYYNDNPFTEKERSIFDQSIKESIIFINTKWKKDNLITKGLKEASQLFTRKGQAKRFVKVQPVYYDNSKIWWMWNKNEYKWEMVDETDILNGIEDCMDIDTISSTAKAEIINSLKQIGRKCGPKESKKTWVQFKDKIFDIETGEEFEATHKYFIRNPIPWSVGESEDTPIIDQLFSEWVEPEWVRTLYENTAYNTTPHKFMQRLIALCGGGANGKGTFIKLQIKFLGEDNCVASEIKSLSEDRFEPAVLFGKLLCVMGEVSQDDLKNTNQLKKLGGEDKISFQFKGKTPFTQDNSATCVCLTNSMPRTPDKSMGFYRKWLIIDFPNQFNTVKRDLIESIPDSEFENLARKCLTILKELYANPEFTNEGSFEERMERYEERSNPIMKFIDENCVEEPGQMITLRDFTNMCNEYMKNSHLRILTSRQIGKTLREEGFIVGNRKIGEGSAVVILNLKLKVNYTTEKVK